MGPLLTRLQLDVAPGILTGPLVFSVLFVVVSQTVEGSKYLAPEPLAPEQAPIVEGHAVLQEEAL
jgi:hypothetical protein